MHRLQYFLWFCFFSSIESKSQIRIASKWLNLLVTGLQCECYWKTTCQIYLLGMLVTIKRFNVDVDQTKHFLSTLWFVPCCGQSAASSSSLVTDYCKVRLFLKTFGGLRIKNIPFLWTFSKSPIPPYPPATTGTKGFFCEEAVKCNSEAKSSARVGKGDKSQIHKK